jgi:hypothetical protein
MKNLSLMLAILCLFLALALIGCSQDSEEQRQNQGGEADLIRLSIGGMGVVPKAGVPCVIWDDENFAVQTMARAETRLPDNRMDKPSITAELSAGATARFAHASTEDKPDAFGANSEFTFVSGDYLYIQVNSGDGNKKKYYRVMLFSATGDARLLSMKISGASVALSVPGKTSAEAWEGSVTIRGMYEDNTVQNPVMILDKAPAAIAEYATGEIPGGFSTDIPVITDGMCLWVKMTSGDTATVLYYKIKVTVNGKIGTPDPAWAADSYNADLRIFPNAPATGILEYPWGSGTDNYFDKNATVNYWNNKGHNHKYPDLFHFANGNKVMDITDWENRRKEIFNILQYYMHGRMPSIEPGVLNIEWSDSGNTCTINLTHVASGRTAELAVTHSPPSGATAGARDKILLLGVGFASARSGWGSAAVNTDWGGGVGGWAGGSTPTRQGICTTLYGMTPSANDTPSVRMQLAWVVSVILTVIEEGGFNGYYDPEKVGIYGYSTNGKSAMLIGAFAESREGRQIGQTFIGSAGSGGPSLDRFIAQAGYKNHTEDPLPVSGAGAMSYNDLKGITWFQQRISGAGGTSAAGENDRVVVRGWTADTPGILPDSLVYGEAFNNRWEPYGANRDGFGGIQNLAQARGEAPGWFSARFGQFNDSHNGLDLDHDNSQTGRGKEGVLCTMPFDAHYIAALIAPRIIYYEDGYATTRNNPEAQWANWLICDEIYRMYAEETGDSSIVWRNAIKIYHISHTGTPAYQQQDEVDLTAAIYGGFTPNAKFRTPPFPVDDPRYRWDFDRMDFGRPGHPTIADRVKAMRESPVKVKAMDTRGLPDTPAPL